MRFVCKYFENLHSANNTLLQKSIYEQPHLLVGLFYRLCISRKIRFSGYIHFDIFTASEILPDIFFKIRYIIAYVNAKS